MPKSFVYSLFQMLGLAGFNSQQAAAAGLAGGRNPFTQQVQSILNIWSPTTDKVVNYNLWSFIYYTTGCCHTCNIIS